MAQKNTLKISGLYTDPNQLSGLPEGALVEADNIIIDRDNVAQPRRGFNQYGNVFGTDADRAKQLLTYKERILVHYNNTLLYNNEDHLSGNDGDFQTFNGNFESLENGLRIKSVESNRNLYFTSLDGIKKISATSADDFTTNPDFITDAGAIRALDVTGVLVSDINGYLPPDSKVAYRIVWGYKDSNENLLLGTPSSRLVISNYSTSNANVELTFAIPQGATDDYFYQIYRTDIFSTTGTSLDLNDIDPGDEMKLVVEDFPTSAEKTAQLIVYDEITDRTFRDNGDLLYTNPNSGEGIGQANEAPPISKDLTMYQNTVFYSNTTTKANTKITLLGLDGLVSGTSSVTLDDGQGSPQTYTFVGEKEEFLLDFTSYSFSTTDDIDGKYFLMNSSSNNRKYFVWYDDSKTTQQLEFSNYIGDITTDLDGKYVVLFVDAEAKYYVWYDYSGSAIDPGTLSENTSLSTLQSIKVDISTALTVDDVETLTATALGTYQPIDDDYDSSLVSLSASGSTVTAGSSSVITSVGHGLNTGDHVNITASTTTPNIDGGYIITKIDDDNFSISATTTVGGTCNWSHSSVRVVTAAFDDLSITADENIKFGFSYKIDTDLASDPSEDTITHSDIIGRTGFRVDISRNINTVADVADATAAAILEQDSAADFEVDYSAAVNDKLVSIINTNNGNTEDAIDSTINGLGSGFTITNVNQGDGEDASLNHVLLSANISPAIRIDETARSLVNVINKNVNDSVYAFYVSGPNDLPGQILLEVRDIGTIKFTVTANDGITGKLFNPALPPATDASEVSGEQETHANRIYYAKLQQPEAVPVLNYIDVGPQDKAISRILALRESLFILKEDGIYRLTGLDGNYSVDLFDESTKIVAPDSAVVLNNQIFCLSNQGVVIISDTGVSIVSKQIDNIINKIISAKIDFRHTTFGVSYETDRSYILWVPETENDTVATQAFRYNTTTNAWTRYSTDYKTCGIVNSGDDKLFLGPSDKNFIERERKNFNRTDHADREYTLQLQAGTVNGDVLTLSSSSETEIGDALVQTQYLTIGEYNQLLSKIDLDPLTGTSENFTVDYSGYAGTVNDLHGKYFIMYSAFDAIKYAVFYDVQGDLPILDPNIFNDLVGASQIRVDISSGVTTNVDIASATQTAIKSITQDFIITYVTSTEFFTAKTVRNGETSDPFDSAVNGIDNGFVINITQQGSGDYLSSLEAYPGDNIKNKVTDLSIKLDADTGLAFNDYQASIAQQSAVGATITAGFPTVITQVNHGLEDGRFVTISNSTPNIDGDYIVNKIDDDNFVLNILTSSSGTCDYQANVNTFEEIQAAFNTLIKKINIDSGFLFTNYKESEGITNVEALIIKRSNNSNNVTVQFSLGYIQGNIILYKHIKTNIVYAPETFGDPSVMKHIREGTFMFEDNNFSLASVGYKTDLSPGISEITFTRLGKGDFGGFTWDEQNWGGGFSGVPLRTFIPRPKQRCRFIQANFEHFGARERWSLFGISFTLRMVTQRAYRE